MLRVISRGTLTTFSGQHFVLFLTLGTPISTVYQVSIICYWKAFKVILQRSICGIWTLPEKGCGCLRKETLVCRVPASGAAVVWRFAERKMHGCEKRKGLTVMRPNSAALQKSIDLFHFCRIPKRCPVSGCYQQIWELQGVQSRDRWMAMLRISLGLSSSELKEQAFANCALSALSLFTSFLCFLDLQPHCTSQILESELYSGAGREN